MEVSVSSWRGTPTHHPFHGIFSYKPSSYWVPPWRAGKPHIVGCPYLFFHRGGPQKMPSMPSGRAVETNDFSCSQQSLAHRRHETVKFTDNWKAKFCGFSSKQQTKTGVGFYVIFKHHPTLGEIISNRYLFRWCETNPQYIVGTFTLNPEKQRYGLRPKTASIFSRSPQRWLVRSHFCWSMNFIAPSLAAMNLP